MTAAPPAPSGPAHDAFSALPRLDRHKPKCGPVRPSKASRKRAFVLIGVHVLIGIHIVHWLATGTTVTPVEPSEAGYLVDEGKLNAGFVLFLSLIAGTLVFGRWFCGWACHVVALQDLCAWLLGKVGLKPRPVRSRLLVLVPFVVAFDMFFLGIVQRWWYGVPFEPVEAAFFTDELWERFPGPLMGVLTFLVVGFLIVWWLGAKGFCTYGCPYGAFFAVADRFAPMRIVVTPACDACGHCTSVCTSNVRVHEEVAKHGRIVDPGCMKCLDCVSVCPKEALYFGLAAPKPFATSQQRLQARADFGWPAEIGMAAIALVATQWTFRGAWFGEGVPFLMSVGLGVITAVFALGFVRLVRRPSLTYQHTALKQNGRYTRAGAWALAGLAAWLAFAAHTFAVRRFEQAAYDAAAMPLSTVFTNRTRSTQRELDAARAALPDALAEVDRALAWDLIDNPQLLEGRGLLLHLLDRHAEAEQALLQALAAEGEGLGSAQANVVLARYAALNRKEYDLAQRLLEYAVRRFRDPNAENLLRSLDELRK